MRTIKITLLICSSLLLLTRCWFICPEKNSIIFELENPSIQTESEKFFIKKVTIAEYRDRNNYIEIIDSSKSTITLDTGNGLRRINLNDIPNNYNIQRDFKTLMKKENIRFEIEIEKLKEFKKNDFGDKDIIFFILKDAKQNIKNKFKSNHPCP